MQVAKQQLEADYSQAAAKVDKLKSNVSEAAALCNMLQGNHAMGH